MTLPPDHTVSTQSAAWRLAVLLVLILGGIAIYGWSRPQASPPQPPLADPADHRVVTLLLNRRDNPSPEKEVPWQEGLTAFALLRAAGIEALASGEGAMLYVTTIDGLESRGAAGWQYEVNGQLGTVSAGVHELQPGDHVLWRYGPYE